MLLGAWFTVYCSGICYIAYECFSPNLIFIQFLKKRRFVNASEKCQQSVKWLQRNYMKMTITLQSTSRMICILILTMKTKRYVVFYCYVRFIKIVVFGYLFSFSNSSGHDILTCFCFYWLSDARIIYQCRYISIFLANYHKISCFIVILLLNLRF